MKNFLFILLCNVSAFGQVAHMPNATPIGPENITIVSAPLNTILQFGKGTTWEPPFASTSLTFPLFVSNTTLNDPIPGTLKEIDAQQTTVAYTVTYIAPGSTIPVIVPVPALTGASLVIPIGGTCSTTIDPATNSLILTISPK